MKITKTNSFLRTLLSTSKFFFSYSIIVIRFSNKVIKPIRKQT